MTQTNNLRPAEATELAWLRRCTVPKYYDTLGNPSSVRRFRWAWIDANSDAWSSNQFALHHVPKKLVDLSAFADEQRFIRLFDDAMPLDAKVTPPNPFTIYEPDQAFPLFECETKMLNGAVKTLRRGLRRDRDFGRMNVVRTSSGTVEMRVKVENQPDRFHQFSIATPFGDAMARVELSLTVYYLEDALDGMRTKTVRVRYGRKNDILYLNDGHGRAAAIRGLVTPE